MKERVQEIVYNALSNIDSTYIILRLSDDFPPTTTRTDIDILSNNSVLIVRQILASLNVFVDNNSSVLVEDQYKEKGYTHIDFCQNGTLLVRFDIVENLSDIYSSYRIDPAFTDRVLARRKQKKIRFTYYKNIPLKIYIPDTYDDLVMRYVEYLEHRKDRPDKIKHLFYVKRKLENLDSKKFHALRRQYIKSGRLLSFRDMLRILILERL